MPVAGIEQFAELICMCNGRHVSSRRLNEKVSDTVGTEHIAICVYIALRIIPDVCPYSGPVGYTGRRNITRTSELREQAQQWEERNCGQARQR